MQTMKDIMEKSYMQKGMFMMLICIISHARKRQLKTFMMKQKEVLIII